MLRRTLVSAALASSLFAADLVLLTLFLNPDAAPGREAVPLARALLLPYAAAGAAVLALLAAAWSLLRGTSDTPRPPLPGLPWLTPLALIAVAAAAAVFWLNLLSYRYSIPAELVRAVAASAVSLTASALVLLAVQIDAWLFPLRGRAAAAALVVLAAAAAVIVPLALRPARAAAPAPVPLATESIEPARRIVLIGIDGIGPDQVRDGISRGTLPAFAQALRRGAHGPLATLRPTEGPPIWTTILTGRFPRDHGIKSFTTYRLAGSQEVFELLPKGALVGALERTGLVTRSPVTAASRKRRALWEILNAFGIQTGTVRVWGTHPPQNVQGFVLSPYFHLLRHDPARAGEALHPPDLLREVAARGVEAEDVERTMLPEFVDLQAQLPADSATWRRELVERALVPDITYERAGAVLRQAYDPAFFVMCYQGLDVVGHAFTRFARPERFGDVTSVEVRRYGAVVDRYAAYVSERVAEAAAAPPARRGPARGLGPRHGAGAPVAARALRADRREARPQRHPRGRPGRFPAGRGRRDQGGRRDEQRLGPRRRAHDPLSHGAARGPRHGRPRPGRDRGGGFRARPPRHLHPQLREPGGDGAARPGVRPAAAPRRGPVIRSARLGHGR